MTFTEFSKLLSEESESKDLVSGWSVWAWNLLAVDGETLQCMTVHGWSVHAWSLFLAQIKVWCLWNFCSCSCYICLSISVLALWSSHPVLGLGVKLGSLFLLATWQVPGAQSIFKMGETSLYPQLPLLWSESRHLFHFQLSWTRDSAPCPICGWWFSRLPKCSAHWHNWSSFLSSILPVRPFRMLDTGWHLLPFLLRNLYTSFKLLFLAASFLFGSFFFPVFFFCPHRYIDFVLSWRHLYTTIALPHSLAAQHCSMMSSVHGIWLVGSMANFVTSWMAPFKTALKQLAFVQVYTLLTCGSFSFPVSPR